MSDNASENTSNTTLPNVVDSQNKTERHDAEVAKALDSDEPLDLSGENLMFELTEPIEREAHMIRGSKRITVMHKVRRGTIAELEARDAAQPYRARRAEKNVEELLPNFSGKADVKLYNKIVLETKGYKLNVTEGQSEAERKAALASIPESHKAGMIRVLTQVKSEVVFGDVDEDESDTSVFWGEDVTYRVRTELFDQGQFVAYTTLREPSQEQLENYAPQRFYLERGQQKPVTRVTVSLLPAVKLFDSLVVSVEGFVYNGKPVDITVPQQLASIDPRWKQDIITTLVEATGLDLGN